MNKFLDELRWQLRHNFTLIFEREYSKWLLRTGARRFIWETDRCYDRPRPLPTFYVLYCESIIFYN